MLLSILRKEWANLSKNISETLVDAWAMAVKGAKRLLK